MSVGYGLVPYGIGGWGSEGVVIPDAGNLSVQSAAPVVDSGVIPTGGAVITGSAPVVLVVGNVKQPGSGQVSTVGHLPSILIDYRVQPAANDAVLQGYPIDIELSSVITPATGVVSLTGVAPTVAEGRLAFPGTGSLTAAGQTPEQDSSITPAGASLSLVGAAPGVAQSEVITPTGGAVIIGGIPGVVVQGSVKTPGTASLSLVGAAPTVAQSRIITPSTGSLSLSGNTPIINNPNWVTINDNQTPNWTLIAA